MADTARERHVRRVAKKLLELELGQERRGVGMDQEMAIISLDRLFDFGTRSGERPNRRVGLRVRGDFTVGIKARHEHLCCPGYNLSMKGACIGLPALVLPRGRVKLTAIACRGTRYPLACQATIAWYEPGVELRGTRRVGLTFSLTDGASRPQPVLDQVFRRLYLRHLASLAGAEAGSQCRQDRSEH